jgi:rubredoxin
MVRGEHDFSARLRHPFTINTLTKTEVTMDRYVCTLCGYVYDPEAGDPDSGVAPGTKWEDVPDDWECPVCGAGKDDFEKEE